MTKKNDPNKHTNNQSASQNASQPSTPIAQVNINDLPASAFVTPPAMQPVTQVPDAPRRSSRSSSHSNISSEGSTNSELSSGSSSPIVNINIPAFPPSAYITPNRHNAVEIFNRGTVEQIPARGYSTRSSSQSVSSVSTDSQMSSSAGSIPAVNINQLPPSAFVTPPAMQPETQAPDAPRREVIRNKKPKTRKRLFSEIENQRKDNNKKSPGGGKGGGGLSV